MNRKKHFEPERTTEGVRDRKKKGRKKGRKEERKKREREKNISSQRERQRSRERKKREKERKERRKEKETERRERCHATHILPPFATEAEGHVDPADTDLSVSGESYCKKQH